MRTLFGVDLNTINAVDGSMAEKWLCTPCVLRWKNKYHTLSPRAEGEQAPVDLKAMMLAYLEDDESRDLYLEWMTEQEER